MAVVASVPTGHLAGGLAAAAERTLAVNAALGQILDGLQRGTTVVCAGAAPVATALAAVAGASQAGSWVAVAGQPTLGLPAAAAAGVALERLVAVHAGQASFDDSRWGEIIAAMIDGFDLILLGSETHRLRQGTARRLQARAKARGAVLVAVGAHPVFTADLRLDSTVVGWSGLGHGHGVAQARTLEVRANGRRMPRARSTTVVIPPASVPALAPVADPIPLDARVSA